MQKDPPRQEFEPEDHIEYLNKTDQAHILYKSYRSQLVGNEDATSASRKAPHEWSAYPVQW